MGFNEMYETWSRESAILKVGLETKVEEIIKGLKEGKLIPSDNVNYVFLLAIYHTNPELLCALICKGYSPINFEDYLFGIFVHSTCSNETTLISDFVKDDDCANGFYLDAHVFLHDFIEEIPGKANINYAYGIVPFPEYADLFYTCDYILRCLKDYFWSRTWKKKRSWAKFKAYKEKFKELSKDLFICFLECFG